MNATVQDDSILSYSTLLPLPPLLLPYSTMHTVGALLIAMVIALRKTPVVPAEFSPVDNGSGHDDSDDDANH